MMATKEQQRCDDKRDEMQTAEPKESLLYQSERKTHTLSFEVSLASQ